MPISGARKLLSILLLLLATTGPLWAQSATLGRGLDQIVQLYESGSPKLAVALKPNITASNGDVLIHVRLLPGANAEQILSRLAQSGFRLQAKSLMDPRLIEGYLPLASARTAAGTAGIKSIHAVLRPRASVGSANDQAVQVEKADLA